MDFLRQVFNQVKDIVKGMNRSQQFILAVICIAIAGTIITLVVLSTQSNLVPLTPETVSYEQAAEIQKYLDEKRIPYTVQDSKLYVPAEQRSKLLIELYGEGVMPEGKDFWEWVFGDSFVESSGKRNERILVSKKRELRRYLMMLPFVKTASVVEKLPQESFTLDESRDHGTASVMLTLKPGTSLSAANVNAIANMVAKAFGSSMEPQDVAIIADGNLYSIQDKEDAAFQSATHLDIERKEEKAYEESIRSFFAPFFQVVVKVNLKMDFTKQKIHTEDHQPYVVESNSTKTSEPVTGSGGGIPGPFERSGMLGQPSPGTPLAITSPSGTAEPLLKTSSQENEKSEVYPKELTDKEVPPGSIQDTSVAIIVPYEKAVLPPGGKAGDRKNEKAQLEENIKTWKTHVAMICGLENQDKISITAMSFQEQAQVPEEPSGAEAATDMIAKYGPQVALLAILLSLLFIGYRFVIRKAAPTELMKELEKAKKEMEPGEELPQIEMPELAIPAPDMKIAQMREWVKDSVKKNPRVAANLVKRWIKS